VNRWRQAAQDANAKPVLTMGEQKELEKLRALAEDPRYAERARELQQARARENAVASTILPGDRGLAGSGGVSGFGVRDARQGR
jgi:hypothetical protein